MKKLRAHPHGENAALVSFSRSSHWDHLLQGRSAVYFLFSRYSRFQGESVRGGESLRQLVSRMGIIRPWTWAIFPAASAFPDTFGNTPAL